MAETTETIDQVVGAVFEGRYTIERVLTASGTGTLFKGTQIAVQRPVAIRIVNPRKVEDPREVARFRGEAQQIAGLMHPNILSLIDFGQDSQGRLYVVREYLEGERLHDLIRREAPLRPARVAHIALQILDALAMAHGQGVVHRDLNPWNIFVTQLGQSRDFIKLLEFRIAPEGGGAGPAASAIDLPYYRSPEELAGRPATPQSDLYAFGVILYEMVTGYRPFQLADRDALARAHAELPPPPLEVEGKRVKGPLAELALWCLQKLPAQRPRDAAEAVSVLDADGPLLVREGTARAAAPRAREGSRPTHAGSAPPPSPHPPSGSLRGAGPQPAPSPATSPMLSPTELPIRRPAPPGGADCALPGARAEAAGLGGQDLGEPAAAGQPAWPFIVAGVFFGGLLLGIVLWFSGGHADPVTPRTAAAAPPAAAAPSRGASAQASAAQAISRDAAPGVGGAPSAAGEAPARTPPEAPPEPAPRDGAASLAPEADAGPSRPDTGAAQAQLHARLSSVPPGAAVVQAGRVIGKTPMTVAWGADTPGAFELSLAGYRTEKLTLGPPDAQGGERVVWLQAEGKAATGHPAPASPQTTAAPKEPVRPERRKPKHRRRKHKRRTKATPSSVKDLL